MDRPLWYIDTKGSQSRGHNRGSGRGRGRGRGHSRNKTSSGNSNDHERTEKHPPHLRGKAIGMFYARKKKEKTKTPKTLATVLLSDTKKRHIQKLLNTSQDHGECSSKPSDFHIEFTKNIMGSIDDKLADGAELIRKPGTDASLLEEQMGKCSNAKFAKMLQCRNKLPAYSKRDEIFKLIDDNQVVVISGETGCGKTTQVTQFILDGYIARGDGSLCNVVCSQPRRISAIAVAERVADERGEALGHSCGFQIRLEKALPRTRGSILYCTTGVILRQMASDPLLRTVSHLVLDEIHERDIMSDFLIALMRKVLPKRPDMKLILMSATLNSEQFSRYYANCPMINIPGFTHEVKEYFLEDVIDVTRFTFVPEERNGRGVQRRIADWNGIIGPHIRLLEAQKKYSSRVCNQLWNPNCEALNLDLIFELIKHICSTAPDNGAILVFVTGFLEISKLIQMMENSNCFPSSRYILIPLHSQMASAEQRHIFKPAPGNNRKIIVSTNIAETSITIDDVVYVIDCGYIKQTGYNPETNQQTLDAQFVSLANAHQRRGRAGRVRPGVCYHLYSRAREMLLDRYQLPEILRTRLENVILTVKSLQLGKAKEFLGTLIDIPQEQSIDVSLELLLRIEALDDNENLTPLGYHLSKLPMHPQMGKMMLFGVIFSCLDPILSICATLDFKDAFQLPIGKEKVADMKKFELSGGIKSDHILNHIVLAEYEKRHNKGEYCWEYFLSQQTVKMLLRMKRQFMDALNDMNFVPDNNSKNAACNLNSHNLSLVKAVVCAGLFPNIAIIKPGRHVKIQTESGAKVDFHLKSIMSKYKHFDSPLLVYYHKVKSNGDNLHDATSVFPLPVIFFGDRYKHTMIDGKHAISISQRLVFRCSESTSDVIRSLRARLEGYLQRAIEAPTAESFFVRAENDIISAIIELITNEDIAEIDLDAFDDE